jgi:hypothetical protein
MLILPGVIVSIVALFFGIYQWKKQRGDVRIELYEMQTTIHIKVCANGPAQITVRDIGYQIRSNRPRLRRLLSELRRNEKDLRTSLSGRLKFAWLIHNLIAMGWCTPLPEDEYKSNSFAPIAGPGLPTKIDGYDDVSWAFDTRHYSDLFSSISIFAAQNPRLRFIARISGHPRREVRSRWLQVTNMRAFAPENAWLFKDSRDASNSEESSTDAGNDRNAIA